MVTSVVHSDTGTRVIHRVSSVEELIKVCVDHKKTCVGEEITSENFFDVQSFIAGVPVVGYSCTALSADKSLGCDTQFLLTDSSLWSEMPKREDMIRVIRESDSE